MKVSQGVVVALETNFAPGDARIIKDRLEALDLPFVDRAEDAERVHLAIIRVGRGSVAAALHAIDTARTDWRDILVAADEVSKIDSAVREHLGQWWTSTSRKCIELSSGPRILAQIDEMITFACAQDDLWLKSEYDHAFQEVQVRLRQRYPYLSEEAVERVAVHAAYQWK